MRWHEEEEAKRRRSVDRSRGSVTAAEEMVASVARRQQRKTAAAAEKVAARSVQSATAGEEAAATGTMTRGVLVAGAAVEEEVDMARRVLVAEAVAVSVEGVAQEATGRSRARGTPEEMVEAAVVRAARPRLFKVRYLPFLYGKYAYEQYSTLYAYK